MGVDTLGCNNNKNVPKSGCRNIHMRVDCVLFIGQLGMTVKGLNFKNTLKC